jgi:hypothetical protein
MLLFAHARGYGQTNVNMATSGLTAGSPLTITVPANCSFNFYDSGGAADPYNSSADATVTFLPSNPATHRIQVTFTSFAVEASWDAFYIFNSDVANTNLVSGGAPATLSLFPAGSWPTTPGTITANTGVAAVGANASEGITFRFRSDASNQLSGWSAIVRQVPKAACAMTAPGPLNASTGPGALSCFANVTTTLPTFSPGGCNAGYQLQYRINGGPPTVETNAGFTTLSVPVGSNTITWELIDPCGGGLISSANQSITVQDNTLPVINIPNDITLTLQPGFCDINYTYSATCTDNCPYTTTGSVAHPIDFNNSQAGIMFDVRNLGSTPMTITNFGPSLQAGTWQMEVYYTTSASSWQSVPNNAAAWTLAGTRTVTSASPGLSTPMSGFSIVLGPGQSRGIYLTSTNGAPLNYTDGSRQFNDANLRVSSNPGAGKQYAFGTTFANRAYNGTVGYFVESPEAPSLVSGLGSGGDYPLGETINTYTCTDANGNSATRTFKVTVLEFPTPIQSLICNDLLNVSLGDNCGTVLLPDDVLEGGPYRCYDFYTVELDKIAPFGNGPWVPAVLGPADIGKTYAVRVTENGTQNKCTGSIKVFDSKAPVVECNTVTVPYNFPLNPTYTQSTQATIKFPVAGLPQNVVDFQTRSYTIPVSGPAGATVTDVDLFAQITGDPFFGNLRIRVESPSGTIVTVWDQLSGCGGNPIRTTLDDEGIATLNCAALSSAQRVRIPNGVGSFSSFDGQPVNGDWKIHVSDLNGGGDISRIEQLDLYVKMLGNFGVGLPNDLTIPPVVPFGNNQFTVPAGLLDECSAVTLSYTDTNMPQNCETGLTAIVSRRWLATDAAGNTSTCIQTIRLLRPLVGDFQFPPNYDDLDEPALDCLDGAYPTPQWISNNGGQGFPTAFGLPTGALVVWQSSDAVTRLCDGSYNITRTWTGADLCSLNGFTHIQYIQVRDKTGPSIACPDERSVTTDPFSCCATVNLPDVLVDDACSRINSISAEIAVVDPISQTIVNVLQVGGTLSNFAGNNTADRDTMAVFGNTPCLPVGGHVVTYTAVDNCGNTGTCSFVLQVNDYSPPVPSCTEQTVVAIGLDDPNDCYTPNAATCEFAGVTVIPAANFDQGSYDNCGYVGFTVRRKAPYSSCITGLNACEYAVATAENDSIKFYCCEVGTIQRIILRVYQLDAAGNITYYPDGTPIYNECEIEVEVQDKLKPVCEPPFNVTVSCENFDPSLWAYGKATIYDNCCLDADIEYQGMKGLSHTANYSQFDTVCNRGTIVRTFRAFDCRGASSSCTQRIVVTYEQDFAIKFPNDVVIQTCNGSGNYGQPTFFGEDCELLGVSYDDQVFTVVPDACIKIERTWSVINWCTYTPLSVCREIPNPTPSSNPSAPENLTGPIVSPQGTPAPWAASVVRILPNDPTPTNYAGFWGPDVSCYKYRQIIKIVDTQDPIVTCPTVDTTCDNSTNNAQLWSGTPWYDPVTMTHDLCEAPVDLSVSATDLCSGANLNIRYLLLLDLDGDGTMETVVSSSNPPAAGTVQYNNLNTPNYTGGSTRTFDNRNVAANQKYRFSLQTTTSGSSMTAVVRWNTSAAPANYLLPELPVGTHKIKWIVEDGCGNENFCEYSFVIRDCKPPSIVCQGGQGITLMPGGMVMLFVSDFLMDADDNCTPAEKLEFGIQQAGGPLEFPVDQNGAPIIKVTLGCEDLGPQMLQIWAQDLAGNADYCTATVSIQDNQNNCNGSNTLATVAGMLQTEMDHGLEECDMELSGQAPNGAVFNQFGMTDQSGHYQFAAAVPMLSDYTLTPTKDNNPLNGVTTYDLVLISKHILGAEPFDSPYKMIAADANRSGSVTTFDIVELRKLILGLYDDLPNNTSWRFVDAAYNFPESANPFQSPFPENKTVADAQGSQMNSDFVAIKIGDVNNTAIVNALMNTTERSNGSLLFDVSADLPEGGKIKVGETVAVKFRASEKVLGYQFTLNFSDLDILDILPGTGMKAENFAIFADAGALTTSWEGEQQAEFTLRFKAKKAGELSKMLGVSSRITKAEAYPTLTAGEGMPQRMDVALRFSDKDGVTITGVGFELYQNMPNPFIHKTLVGFHLPDDGEATLSVFDENGRLLHTQKGKFAKGYNSFPIERAMLNTTGLLYYTVQAGNDSATRKMIQTK